MTDLPHIVEAHRPTGVVIAALQALDYEGYGPQLWAVVTEYHERLHLVSGPHASLEEATERHDEELIDRALDEMATRGESHPEL
jgi:hypothetical protein